MKRINLSELLSGIVVAGVAVTLASCGGGSGGNGVSQSGFYQFSIQGAPQGVVYSIDPASLSIPLDTWQFTATFNSESGASSSSALITSVSLCVQEQGLSISCMPVSFTNSTIQSGNEATTTAQFNFYKFGQYALEANPYQDLTLSEISSTVPVFISPASSSSNLVSYSPGSATVSYAPTFYLANNLVPGTVDVAFSYSMPVTAIVSSTTLSNSANTSSTASSSTSSSETYQGYYTITGMCVDNGSGSFNTVSSDTGIVCSGSIQYTNGYVSNFSISQYQSATISTTTISTSSGSSSSAGSNGSGTSTNSTTIIYVTTYIINAGASNSTTPSLSVSYLYSSTSIQTANLSSSVVYAYIPSTTSYNVKNGLYTITSVTPQGVYVVLPPSTTSTTSSSTVYYPCSQISCNLNNGIFSATLPITVSSNNPLYLNVVYDSFYTYEPNIFITTHVPMVSLPYTVNATANVGGSTMNATYNGTLTILSP